MEALRNFLCIVFAIALSCEGKPPLEVDCRQISGAGKQGLPAIFGESNDGFFDFQPSAVLSQGGSAKDGTCSSITGGVQSSLYAMGQSEVLQSPGAKLQLGNYSRVVLATGCELSMKEQAEIRPDQAFGAGRIEVYCSAEWSMGVSSYMSLGRQSFVNVSATLTVGDTVIVDLQPSSSLLVGDELVLRDSVWLTLEHNARLLISPVSGGVAQVTSSKTGLTRLTLKDSAVLSIDGDFLVGAGTHVTMTLEASGSLAVPAGGQFQVEAADFVVGPSSFWVVDGNFLLDGDSTFSSGMQSNLTVSGNLETRSGSLIVDGFSSVLVKGSCINKGTLGTKKFSQLIMWPGSNVQLTASSIVAGEWSTVDLNGAVTLNAASAITLASGADFQQYGTLTMLNSKIDVGEGASVQILAATKDELILENCQITLGRGAELIIASGTRLSAGAQISLGPGARMELRNDFEMRNGSFSLQQGAYFAVAQQFAFEGGSMVLGRGARAVFNGTATATAAYAMTLGAQASVVLEAGAKFAPAKGSSVTVGDQTDVLIRQGASITVGDSVAVVVGTKSLMTFDPSPYSKMTCFVNADTTLPTFTNTTFAKNAKLPLGDFWEWSECDPCTGLSSRHINVTAPPHFDGFPCPSRLLESQTCRASQACPADLPCPGQFDCQLLGRGIPTQCLNRSLVCNGQQDCQNNADEANCTTAQFSRAEEECLGLERVPFLDQIGSGVHVRSGELVGVVLDNSRYHGYCRKAFDGDSGKVYRLPFNVNNFHFHVRSSDDLSVKTYDSLQQYSNEKDRESQDDWNQGASVHGGFGGFSFHVDESLSYTHSETWKQIFTGMKDTNNVLFTVKAQFEVAQFIMKSENLLLDAYMEAAVHKLPTAYSAKPYVDFFEEFGVFYLHAGALGGTYEHNYIFDSTTMKRSAQTTTTLKQCLKFSVSGGFGFGAWGGSASYGFDKCHSANGDQQSSRAVSELAQHKVVHIDGGTTKAAGDLVGAAIQGNDTFQVTKFQEWVAGVASNPVLLRRTLRPVCDLIRSAHSGELEAKYRNCLTAAEVYVRPWSASVCRGCKNGGKSVNMGGQCQCVCPAGYMGQACAQQVQDPHYLDAYEYVMGRPLHRHAKAQRKELPRLRVPGAQKKATEDSESLASQSDIKLLTSGNPPVAKDPPYMNRLSVGPYDNTLKNKEDKVYYVSTPGGIFMNRYGVYSGGYSIVQLNEYLEVLQTTAVDFASVSACSDPEDFVFCHLKDYDVDVHGNFVVSFLVTSSNKAASSSSVYTIDGTTGKALAVISEPCVDEAKDRQLGVYVSTTCGDSIVISCPGYAAATVKTYTLEGKAQGLAQLPGFTHVTGVQHFNGQVWVHTLDNKVAAFDMENWDLVFNYTTPFRGDTGDALFYSQLFVDFAGNLLVAQAHDAGSRGSDENYKLSVLDTNSRQPLAHVRLSGWNGCQDVATYRGKAFTMCHRTGDVSDRAILVFDYLK